MKLGVIYNLWDGIELLRYSIQSLVPLQSDDCELVFIFVYQTVSNWGEDFDPRPEIESELFSVDAPYLAYDLVQYVPDLRKTATANETCKRNLGIRRAAELGCDHFLNADTDECYLFPRDMLRSFLASGADGSCCWLYTYLKSPRYRCLLPDGYYVPWVHKLTPGVNVGIRNPYPFYVDPTRRVSHTNVVLLGLEYAMHHYSYVRRDIRRKAANSSARNNIAAGSVLRSYELINEENADGFYVKDWDREICVVNNLFGIPEIL